MASGFFALFDDIATLLDDAAVMSKVATKKTAGLLSDDLAVNAEKATGFHASRELPVIWAITKGSLLNKVIILPLAFLLSSYMPWLIVPILLIGGAYLSYEGFEKVTEWLGLHEKPNIVARGTDDPKDLVTKEKAKIRSAIKTDFVLSIEIIIIALSTVLEQPLVIQLIAVSFVALLATVGVYGVVAMLVRMDDAGFALIDKYSNLPSMWSSFGHGVGRVLVAMLPKIIKLLSVIGTIAMLLVGGGMYLHNIETIHHFFVSWPPMVGDLLLGILVGASIYGLVTGLKRFWQPKAEAA